MRFLIIFLLLTSVCFAGEINEKYSYQAYPYHDLSFKDRPAEEFNNTIIVGSCFYQEWVEGDKEVVKDIFPDGIKGVTFRKCNLDNIKIPKGNIVEDGTNKKIKVQNDFWGWILNDDLTPKEPINKEQRLKVGISIDPKDIPKKKFTKEEREQFERRLNETDITPTN